MSALQLFVRAECHLCELAIGVLHETGIAMAQIDIDDDLDLAVRYGLRIPVLRDGGSGLELDWPFDAAAVRAWLAQASG